MKLLLIGDIHTGTSRESTTHPGISRQGNTEALETLRSLIPHFQSLEIDLVVNFGDIIRDVHEKEIDRENMHQTLELLNTLNIPKIHLLGNHELKSFTRSEIEQQYTNETIEPKFWGKQQVGNFQVIWLDFEIDQQGEAYLPEERLAWLRSTLQSDMPSILLSHYSIVPVHVEGSFYFEKEPTTTHYINSQQILDVLDSNKSVFLAVNAHVHMLSHLVRKQVHFISNLAFSENIAADQFPSNNPGIYTILDLSNEGFVHSTYSGAFCFSKIEGKLS